MFGKTKKKGSARGRVASGQPSDPDSTSIILPARSLGQRRASRWRQLEQRLAFDGAGAAVVVEAADGDSTQVPGSASSPVQSLDDAPRRDSSAAPVTQYVPDATADHPETTAEPEVAVDPLTEAVKATPDSAVVESGEQTAPVAVFDPVDSVDAETVIVVQASADPVVDVQDNSVAAPVLDDALYMGGFETDPNVDADTGGSESDDEAFTDAAGSQYSQIVFVDEQATDYESLVAGIVEDIDLASEGADLADGVEIDRDFVVDDVRIIVIDRESGGIEQITGVLASETGLEAIHLVSHGTDGTLRLGNEWVDAASVSTHEAMIASWNDALAEDADLLVYGCELASNENGQLLVSRLATLTGADVAASDDMTGTAKLGGDWDLEFSVGQVTTRSFDVSEAAWSGLLDPFVVTSAADSGSGTLRDAIALANTNGAADTISFAIAADSDSHFYYRDDGVAGQVSLANISNTTESDDSNIFDIDPDYLHSWYEIDLESELNTITEAVTIDGTAAAANVPGIVLDGSGAGADANGLVIGSGGDSSEVRGLTLNNFSQSGIQVIADDVTIAGTHIGVDVSGTIDQGNADDGIQVTGQNVVIGGIDESDRNIISGNDDYGIWIDSTADGAVIQNNHVGTNAAGTAAIGNASDGLLVEADFVTIGGVDAGNVFSGNGGDGIEVSANAEGVEISNNLIGTTADGNGALGNDFAGLRITGPGTSVVVTDNVISSNTGFGIVLSGEGPGSTISGNFIGTGSDGTGELGNGDGGIHIRAGSSENMIGGIGPADANVIAHNGFTGLGYGGISVDGDTSVDNVFLGNRIFSNQGGSIDLMEGGQTGQTPNDPGDADTGPNDLLNAPVITDAVLVGGDIEVTIDIDSTPGSTYRLQIFATNAQDTSGSPDLATFLGFADAVTGQDGLSTITIRVGAAGLVAGQFISATATMLNSAGQVQKTSEAAHNVAVGTANTAPELGETEIDVTVAEGAAVAAQLTANDPDVPGQTLVWSIVGGADANQFSVSQDGTLEFLVPPDYENPQDNGLDQTYEVQVQVDDGQGGIDMQLVRIAVTPVDDNTPDIISNGAGGTASIQVNEGVTDVTTVVATDADVDGTPVQYSISGGADANLFTIDAVTGAVQFLSPPDAANPADSGADNVYNIEVTASDGTLSDSQALTISVNNLNEAPEFTSHNGADQVTLNVVEGELFVTTVTAVDPDAGDTVSYELAGGADASLFSLDSATGRLEFIDPANFEFPQDANGDNVYEVVIHAHDAAGAEDVQTLLITALDRNEAPVIQTNGGQDSATISVAEGISLVTTVNATDVDQADAVTYSLGGADADRFTLDAATREVRFIDAPDFENPADANGDNSYNITLTVTDSAGLTDVQQITVDVTGQNEGPTIESNGGGLTAEITIDEGTNAVTTVAATDPDLPVQTLTYSISGGVDASFFEIDAATGELVFSNAPDAGTPNDIDGDNIYEVIVRVDDGNGSADSQTLNVRVAAVASAPEITSGAGADATSVSIDENTTSVTTVTATDADPGDTRQWSVTGGADRALFAIDSLTGELEFVSAPDFENPLDASGQNSYVVEVTVTDSTGRQDSQLITVNVNGVNENPVVTSGGGAQQVRVERFENSTEAFTVQAINVDDPSVPIQYGIMAGNADADRFTIDSQTGELRFVTAPDFENPDDVGKDNVYSVLVVIQNGTGGIVSQYVEVVIQGVNEDPEITSQGGGASASIGMFEANSGVATVAARDPDAGQDVSFAISGGRDGNLFSIDSKSGELVFRDAPVHAAPADEDGDNVYQVVVVADDGNGGKDYFTYNVYVFKTPASVEPIETPEPETPMPVLPQTPDPTDVVLPAPPEPPTETPVVETTEETDSTDEDGNSDEVMDDESEEEREPLIAVLDSLAANEHDGRSEFANSGLRQDIRDLTQSLIRELDSLSRSAASVQLPQSGSSDLDLLMAELMPVSIDDNGLHAHVSDARQHIEYVSAAIDNLIGRMVEQMEEDSAILVEHPVVASAVVGATVSLSVGYASWLLRFGYLLTGVLTYIPALRSFDPIPVLASDDEEEDLFKKNSAELTEAEREVRAIFSQANLDLDTVEIVR